jgi:16S rRNA processing protein RimM
MTSEPQVTLAAIAGAHGITGEVRLKLFAEGIDSLKRQQIVTVGGRPLTIAAIKQGANPILRFAGIDDRNAAEALRGQLLTVARAALPPLEEGEYYHVDLLGLPAVSDAGDALGKVVAIDNYGAGDVLEIERPDGKRFMVPMQPEAVPEWDAERLVVHSGFAE